MNDTVALSYLAITFFAKKLFVILNVVKDLFADLQGEEA
jgi:hypothetical protein